MNYGLGLFDFAVDGWAEGLADRLLEQINRQKDPVLRRRLVAEEFRKVAVLIARETANQFVREEI